MLSKRKSAVIITLVLVFTLSCILLTLALLTDRKESVNTFQFGEVDVTLVDNSPPNQDLIAGSFISRSPVIRNNGETCFVRAVIAVSDADNSQPIMEFIDMGTPGDGWYVKPSGEDGIWNETNKVTVYYQDRLEKGQVTSRIFNGFTLLEANEQGALLAEGINNTFHIDIAVEAVQAGIGNGYFDSPEAAFEEVTGASANE